MASSATRRLALHASALSDVEYDLYTSSLRDLALVDEDPERRGEEEDDAYFEKMKIGVREVRAWLRGRYSHVSVAVIDTILRMFSPNLGPGDLISGSEFFAALRLVIHAENGAEIERSLAFVQANPAQNAPQSSSSKHPGTSSSSRPTVDSRSVASSSRPTSSPRKRSSELPPPPPHHPNIHATGSPPIPPPMPSRRPHTESVVSASSTKSSKSHTLDPSSSTSIQHNPFSQPGRESPTHYRAPQPPLHPSQRSESSKSSSAVGTSTQPHSAHNPFVQRAPPQSQTRSEDGTGASTSKIPPLPPRKPPPPPVPPPQHASLSTRNRLDRSISPTKRVPSNTLPPPVPPPPPKPPHHATSNLIKQSLQASKVAQSIKRAEEQLEKERIMQVLKSSSSVSGSYSLAGASVVNSSVVIGTHVHHQQHQPNQMARGGSGVSPERPGPGRTYAPYASSSGSEGAPPLPERRKQHQQYVQYREEDEGERHRYPSPPLSASSMEQVALASLPPSTQQARRNVNQRPNTADPFAVTSPFRSPPPSVDVNAQSPEHSPSRSDPPPTHPDRKPYLPYQVLHSSSTSFPRHDGDEAGRRSFDDIYGTNSIDASPSTPSRRQTTNFPPLPQGQQQQQGRVFRSRSMHQTSPTQAQLQTLPPPPVRRRRPESVQVLKSGEVLVGSLSRGGEGTTNNVGLGLGRPSGSGMNTPHRRSSLSVSMTPTTTASLNSNSNAISPSNINGNTQGYADSPLTNFQRTIAATLQPRFDKARYKAEAGLSKRGFVRDPHHAWHRGEEEEGLMSSSSPSGEARKRGGEAGLFDDPEVDEDEDWSRSRGMEVDTRDGEEDDDVFNTAKRGEKDDLKWPSGEGWKPL